MVTFSKNNSTISVDFQGKLFNITLIQVYTTNTDSKEVEVDWFYEDLQNLQPKKQKCPFHHRELDCKSRKSRDTWNNGQVWTCTSLVAQMVKCLSIMQATWVQSLSQEDPLEKDMATNSSIIAWKIPWMEEPGSLQSMGSQRVKCD